MDEFAVVSYIRYRDVFNLFNESELNFKTESIGKRRLFHFMMEVVNYRGRYIEPNILMTLEIANDKPFNVFEELELSFCLRDPFAGQEKRLPRIEQYLNSLIKCSGGKGEAQASEYFLYHAEVSDINILGSEQVTFLCGDIRDSGKDVSFAIRVSNISRYKTSELAQFQQAIFDYFAFVYRFLNELGAANHDE